MLCLALPITHCKIRPSQLCYLSSSVGRALGLESRVSWVRVPPEPADFSLKKSSLNCVVLLCTCILEGVLKFVYHVHAYIHNMQIPGAADLYSYYVDCETRRLENWEKIIPAFKYNPEVCTVYTCMHMRSMLYTLRLTDSIL